MRKVPIDFEPVEFTAELTLSEGSVPSVLHSLIATTKAAQRVWAAQPLASRLAVIRRFRNELTKYGNEAANSARNGHAAKLAEILSSQVIPLADACKFLERNAAAILRNQDLRSAGRPLWLTGVKTEILREPFGVVLILGPSNYPLFLPAVQTLQALAAGNAVLWKPGHDGTNEARRCCDMLVKAGLDPKLVTILPEEPEFGIEAIQSGVDKVILTGSSSVGREVLAAASQKLIPVTAELSGCDAVFVRHDADLDLTTKALIFGLRLNNGETCIAPRRVFVPAHLAFALEKRLMAALKDIHQRAVSLDLAQKLRPLLSSAYQSGARILAGEVDDDGSLLGPVVLTNVRPEMELVKTDVFGQVLSIIYVDTDEHALEANAVCPYALGATIFSKDQKAARDLASRINAGIVTINDLIVPTADPRVPFGGRGESGFGTTRGAEGLLEMTRSKVIASRVVYSHSHFEPASPFDASLFSSYLAIVHGQGLHSRLRAALALIHSIFKRQTYMRRASI